MTSIERSERDRSLAAAVPEARDPAPAPLEPAGARPAGRLPPTHVAGGDRRRPGPAAGRGGDPHLHGGGVERPARANAAAARVVSAADMEREYGIRVNLVAVTADGGLVDVRFTVVDKDKAGHILHDSASMPDLFVETTGAVLSTRNPMAHKQLTLLDGATYFLLYPNSGGVDPARHPRVGRDRRDPPGTHRRPELTGDYRCGGSSPWPWGPLSWSRQCPS